MPGSIKSFLKEWGLLILLTFFVSSCRSFLAEPRYIPSGSMLPELKINDEFIEEKLSIAQKYALSNKAKLLVAPEGTLSNNFYCSFPCLRCVCF